MEEMQRFRMCDLLKRKDILNGTSTHKRETYYARNTKKFNCTLLPERFVASPHVKDVGDCHGSSLHRSSKRYSHRVERRLAGGMESTHHWHSVCVNEEQIARQYLSFSRDVR